MKPRKRPTRHQVPVALPPEHDWLFEEPQVPSEELAACVCWEYLREVRPEDVGPAGLSDYALDLVIRSRENLERRRFNDSFGGIPLRVSSFLALHENFPLPLPSWQALPGIQRRQLIQPAPPAWPALIDADLMQTSLISWELRFPDRQGFSIPRPWGELQRELYAWMVAYRARYGPPDQSSPPPQSGASAVDHYQQPQDSTLSKDDPRYYLAMSAPHRFIEPLPFVINWMEYTPDEIADAVKRWLHEHTPGFAIRKRGRGTNSEQLRGALRDLGALRIMNAMTEPELKRRHAAYDKFRARRKHKDRDELPELNLAAMKRRALLFFTKYFSAKGGQKPSSLRSEKKTNGGQRGPDLRLL